jgi:hypothetical protein
MTTTSNPKTRPHGTLFDGLTGEPIGPATAEQRAASNASGKANEYLILVDPSRDMAVVGPYRAHKLSPRLGLILCFVDSRTC